MRHLTEIGGNDSYIDRFLDDDQFYRISMSHIMTKKMSLCCSALGLNEELLLQPFQ